MTVQTCFCQEFRAKKLEKIRRMISDRLRQDAQTAESSSDLDTMRDLHQVMSAISSQTKTTTKTKGSRFAHTEKLLFKQVRLEGWKYDHTHNLP